MSEPFPARWFSTLTSFDPPRGIEAPPDWEAAVQLLAEHGLASIAAYNLQYRMPEARAPELAKDVLLGYYQGLVNDNVYKLVTLKQALAHLTGAGVVLLDAAAYADTLYPHVAFRPVPELKLLVRPAELEPVAAALRESEFFAVDDAEPDPEAPALILYNKRFHLKLFTTLLPEPREEAGLWGRVVKARPYGAGAFRPSAEDALLLHVLSQARAGFALPLISWVDLRELVRGTATSQERGGPGAPLDAQVVKGRAKAFGVERPLWAALELLRFFHPELEEAAKALSPELGLATRTALDAAVVGPAKNPLRERQLRGVGKLVQLLLG